VILLVGEFSKSLPEMVAPTFRERLARDRVLQQIQVASITTV